MKVCCVFSLELPHRGDSYEYTQYTIFNIKKKITLNEYTQYTIFKIRKKVTLNYPKSAAIGFFPGDLKVGSCCFKCIVILLIYFLNCM